MSKYTTETATLKALVIDTNVLKINGFVFKPTMEGLTLTPPSNDPVEEEEEEDDETTGGGSGSGDETTGGQGESGGTDTETGGGSSSGDETTGGGNVIIGGGSSTGIIIGGGETTNTIIQETTIVKEQKLKTIIYTIGELITGITNDVYTCSLDNEENVISVKLLNQEITLDNWSIEKVLINGRFIMCPIYQTTDTWDIKFAEIGDVYRDIYGGIDDDTKIKIYLTYDEPLETTVEDKEDEVTTPEPPEDEEEKDPENPEESEE